MNLSNPSGHDKITSAFRDVTVFGEELFQITDNLLAVAKICAESLKKGGKILFCGNGGSAAESQHLATEFVVRLVSTRNRGAMPALALTADTSLLTACANDYGFDAVFARQVEAHLQEGDVLIVLSTSGKSPNLIEAARVAKEKKGKVIAFLGSSPTPLDGYLDGALRMPSTSTQRIQEGHLICGHLLVELIEDLLMESGTPQ
jgi:D-sedoheptulose 7-phosphate isomerase